MRGDTPQRRQTSAELASTNPILSSGEIAYETDNDRFCFGDGETRWSRLPKFVSEGSSSGGGGGLTPADLTPDSPSIEVLIDAADGYPKPRGWGWMPPALDSPQPNGYLCKVNDGESATFGVSDNVYHAFVPNIPSTIVIRAIGVFASAPSTDTHEWVVEENPDDYVVTSTFTNETNMLNVSFPGVLDGDGLPYVGPIPFSVFTKFVGNPDPESYPDNTWVRATAGGSFTTDGVFAGEFEIWQEGFDISAGVMCVVAPNGEPILITLSPTIVD